MNRKDVTTQDTLDEEMAEAFEKYQRINRRVQSGAINDVDTTRKELLDILHEYASDDGLIRKSSVRKLLRQIEFIEGEIERIINERVEEEIDEAIDRSINSTLVSLGALVTAGVISKRALKKRVRDEMFGDLEGVDIEDRLRIMAGGYMDAIKSDIRRGVYRGDSIYVINRRLKRTFEKNEWLIRRVIMTEGLNAYRKTIGYMASDLKEKGVIFAVKIIDNRGRHPRHETHECYKLAERNQYGWGKGVYRPEDEFIYDPHPQCTAYFTFVIDRPDKAQRRR